ncbi:peptidase, partial [Rhizoctonia solani]
MTTEHRIATDREGTSTFDVEVVPAKHVAMRSLSTIQLPSLNLRKLFTWTLGPRINAAMIRTLLLTAACLYATLVVHAAPVLNVPISKHAGPVKANSYIIKLKDGVSKDSHIAKLLSKTSDSKVKYKYEQAFHGYAIELKGKDLDFVRQSNDVEYILEDGIFTIQYETPENLGESRPANESIGQLSKRANGAGVDVYSIDTGIYTAHNSFGGRARWGATFGGYSNADGNGHGTHTAAIAVGANYGIATSANIIAVKVLSDSGSGTISDVIAGINYIISSAQSSGRPSIATFSIGGGANNAVDSAVNNLISSGVHCTVAAGGSNVDAGNESPARVAAANTVGAVDSSNRRASFSSYGSVIDVWAPGVSILSAWIGNPSATNTLSGTSMSTPFVAGILAVAIGDYGNKSPAQLSSDLKLHARAVVTGVPSGTTNLLATRW